MQLDTVRRCWTLRSSDGRLRGRLSTISPPITPSPTRLRQTPRLAVAVVALLLACHSGEPAAPAAKPDAAAGVQAAAEHLIAALRGDDSDDAAAALVALGPPAVPALVGGLHDPDEDMRLAVVDVLSRIGAPDAVQPLITALG